MKAFSTFAGLAAPMPGANIDTDQISPARFLLRSREADYSRILFHDRRFSDEGRERDDAVLNQAPWRRAEIIVAGSNFGCGSAREQAVWALVDFGIRAILAPTFGSIFRGNCTRNGLLAACVDDRTWASLLAAAKAGERLSIDLERCTVAIGAGSFPFELPEAERDRLLKGLDDIDLTESHRAAIDSFSVRHARDRPWAAAIPRPPGS